MKIRPLKFFDTFLALCLFMPVASAQTSTSRFLDIIVQLDSTWHSQDGLGNPTISHRAMTAHCAVGTNTWLIEGDFILNGRYSYLLIGTNIIHQTLITKETVIRPGGIVAVSPEVGDRYVQIFPSPDGRPAGQGLANLAWLAFCSGQYLKHEGREIPLPVGPASQNQGVIDKTAVFDDGLGLPKSVELRASDGQLVGQYEVLQSTNLSGWNFPLRFKMTQYGQLRNGRILGNSRTEVFGKTLSIVPGQEPMTSANSDKLGH